MARVMVSVNNDTNFKNRCEREQKAFDEWPYKWRWITEEYKYENYKNYTFFDNNFELSKEKEIGN